MVFTALLILITVVPAMIWLGISIWRRRAFHQGNHTPDVDGGSPTIYRRRTTRGEFDAQRGGEEQGPTPA